MKKKSAGYVDKVTKKKTAMKKANYEDMDTKKKYLGMNKISGYEEIDDDISK